MNRNSSTQSFADDIKSFIDNLVPDNKQKGYTGESDVMNDFRRSTSLNSYEEEWNKLFGNNFALDNIKKLGLTGDLRNCRFRSICWRIYLHVLSCNNSLWRDEVTTSRLIYEGLKEKYIIDPRKNKNDEQQNDDPLSMQSDSPWNKYFKSQETMKEIKQDVVRTFPEIQYFHSPKVRQAMINILYCYSQHTGFSYKQGWHELLAPLIFVLHCDLTAYEHSCELSANSTPTLTTPPTATPPGRGVEFYNFVDCSNDTEDVGNQMLNWHDMMQLAAKILDSNYLEHDAYVMFEFVMNVVQPWYDLTNEVSGTLSRITSTHVTPSTPLSSLPASVTSNISNGTMSINELSLSRRASLVDVKPFEKPKEQLPDCSLVKKVNRIHEEILKRQDLELYMHLNQLEISPQMFGFRWLKLLFGREFTLQDLLLVWDVIFAINSDDPDNQFNLTDQLYVAMLIYIRDCLLLPMPTDFASCLTRLMRYPKDTDVSRIISYALYLYDPDMYQKPLDYSNYRGINFPISNSHNKSVISVAPVRSSSSITTRKKRGDRNKTIGIETFTNRFSSFISKRNTNEDVAYNYTESASRPTTLSGTRTNKLPSVSDSAPVTPTNKQQQQQQHQHLNHMDLSADYLEISLASNDETDSHTTSDNNQPCTKAVEFLNRALNLLSQHSQQLSTNQHVELNQAIILVQHTRDMLVSSSSLNHLNRRTLITQLNSNGNIHANVHRNQYKSSVGNVGLNRSVSSNDIVSLLQSDTDLSLVNKRRQNSNSSSSTSTVKSGNIIRSGTDGGSGGDGGGRGDISEKLRQLFPNYSTNNTSSGLIKPVELQNIH